MKKLILILLFIFPIAKSLGQSITPQTLNVGGSKPATSGISLDYSIGESSSISFYKLSNNNIYKYIINNNIFIVVIYYTKDLSVW